MEKVKKILKVMKKIIINWRAKITARWLVNNNFTIISNNCWWWHIYNYFWLKYNSPFIWLFLFPECYMKLLGDLENYMSKSLSFIPANKSKYYDKIKLLKKDGYPIGILNDDIEIHFLHFSNAEEALEKWTRRKKRINYQNLLVKFTNIIDWNEENLAKKIELLWFKNKIIFSCPSFSTWNEHWEYELRQTRKNILKIKNILNQLRKNKMIIKIYRNE